ncbi:1,5-anhydro-D-fructose reductase-like isoform X1 [Ruditapes philippinarum]|uniref:1,5-anhydro-D-fructose reductase-like isoform X1 n=1 Tax=Ruditapes philippinarum TaxID=129788 RepID=UPI00295B482B|nr:1,5-anhydro-D-fructose reductase-like isoform X1 [Ruditapes philippinarum]
MDLHSRQLTLGSGIMPSVGLGTFTFFGKHGSPDEMESAVGLAIDAGYRHFDCAWVYGTQGVVGRMLEKKINEGVIEREDVFITTKLWNTHHNPKLVLGELKESLNQLRTNYVDMFLMHYPTGQRDQGFSGELALSTDTKDYECYPLEDVWKEMERCHQLGLTKNIGLSNFTIDQTKIIFDCCTIKPSNIQIEVTPYFLNERLVKFCIGRGMTVTSYCPLGSPTHPVRLAGEKGPLEDPVLMEMSKEKGKSVAQIILRFLIQYGTSVIPKSVTPSRIKENINVFDFELTEKEMQSIKSLNKNKRLYNEIRLKHHPEYPFDAPL